MDIFVMAAAGGDPVRLTEGPADDLSPRWSPDSRHLAFLSDRGMGADIFLIPPLGGTERKLTETNIPWLELASPAFSALGVVPWSPDGSELLFSRRHPTGEIALWKINPTTGEQTQLTRPPPGAFDLDATWSFDGERIAFSRHSGRTGGLWLMDARTGEPEPLLEDEYRNAAPAWTADNERLVFVSNRAGPRNLWEIDVGSRRHRQVTTGPGPDVNPVVSTTGRLAYAQYRHQIDLYWGRVDQPQDEHRRLTSTTANNFGGRISPDGRQLLYYSDRTGNYELWLVERETGAERQLTNHPGRDIMADWSPDGRQIVFASNREGALQIWVVPVEGGRTHRLSKTGMRLQAEPHFGNLRWSPDGDAVGFLAPGETAEVLWLVDPQGENQRSVLSGIIGFDFYRDSRHIVYTRAAEDGSGLREMRVRNLETGADSVLLRGPYAEMVVAPDGRAVSYVDAASHFDMQLHVLQLAPPASPGGLPQPVGEPRQVTFREGLWHVHNGGWSPDGEALVYSRDADAGNIYVIDNYR
jgi:Tol biopolymer transport system component